MGKILVEGIRCYAYHGCLKEETKIGGEYSVDVSLIVDLTKPSISDQLDDTADYCKVYDVVKSEMKTPSKLLEHVGQRILNALKKEFTQAERVKVRVTKINPPMNGDVKQVSVVLKV